MGGQFEDELNAAKRVNQICEEFGIPQKNPEVSGGSSAERNKKSSKYIGVCWIKSRKTWRAEINHNGKRIYGGYCGNELDAAKRVNRLCEQIEISRKNPEIKGAPEHESTTKIKTSKYNGVCWRKENQKWVVQISHNKKQIYGGYFENEINAAQRVNQLYEKMGKSQKNPEISEMPTHGSNNVFYECTLEDINFVIDLQADSDKYRKKRKRSNKNCIEKEQKDRIRRARFYKSTI